MVFVNCELSRYIEKKGMDSNAVTQNTNENISHKKDLMQIFTSTLC